MIDGSQIPQALRNLNQWLCWQYGGRDGKPTKIPINPRTGMHCTSYISKHLDTRRQNSMNYLVRRIRRTVKKKLPFGNQVSILI